jgi:hypothetical protein
MHTSFIAPCSHGYQPQLDLGPFADLSKEEFLAQKLGLNGTGLRDIVGTPITAQQNPAPSGNTPTQVNWVAQRKVAPIKDQGAWSYPSCVHLWYGMLPNIYMAEHVAF